MRGTKSPQASVGQDAEIPQAVVEVPFDLLRWILAGAADPCRPVEADVPGLGVSDSGGMLPRNRGWSGRR